MRGASGADMYCVFVFMLFNEQEQHVDVQLDILFAPIVTYRNIDTDTHTIRICLVQKCENL